MQTKCTAPSIEARAATVSVSIRKLVKAGAAISPEAMANS